MPAGLAGRGPSFPHAEHLTQRLPSSVLARTQRWDIWGRQRGRRQSFADVFLPAPSRSPRASPRPASVAAASAVDAAPAAGSAVDAQTLAAAPQRAGLR